MNNQYKISDWEELILNSSLSEEEKQSRLTLVKNLYANNVPVIIDLKHLAGLLGLKQAILASMIHSPKSFYRAFKIPKKRGGFRDIVTPYKSLLEVQQWIVENILSQFPIHDKAYAYVKNRNIALNAKEHIGNAQMLKIDIKDFFHSIKIPRVRELFNRVGYSKEVAGYLTKLCCLNGALPQGAATSPMISNIILKTLDKRLSELTIPLGITYTRYADDLVFSGVYIPHHLEVFIQSKIEAYGFSINHQKTKRYEEDDRKMVTGVVVGDIKIRLPKVKRKEIKLEVYYLKKFGILDQVNRYNDIFYIDRVLGRLSFWKQIEPENEYVLNSIHDIKEMYKKFTEE